MSSSSTSSCSSMCGCCFQFPNANANEPCDKCGGRRKNCKPKPTDSLGFKNYYKMFLCRFPDMDKCVALRKARCIYGNLSENSKQKYRDLGCDFRCCARRKVKRLKRLSCPKPKRKARNACKARRQPKCRPKRKPKAKPCPPPTCYSSEIFFNNIFLEYMKSKAAREQEDQSEE